MFVGSARPKRSATDGARRGEKSARHAFLLEKGLVWARKKIRYFPCRGYTGKNSRFFVVKIRYEKLARYISSDKDLRAEFIGSINNIIYIYGNDLPVRIKTSLSAGRSMDA